VPLLEAGVPAVLLVDFRDPVWHTHRDVPEMCSAERLGEVGRVVERLVWGRLFH
jgi:hypothetical protein